LFTEDGVWDGGPSFGRYQGHEQIRKFFESIFGTIVFAAHLVLNPIITVDGSRARGRWCITCRIFRIGRRRRSRIATDDETRVRSKQCGYFPGVAPARSIALRDPLYWPT
jgi:hypothetical protein